MPMSAKAYLKTRAPRFWAMLRTTNQLRKLIPRVYGYEPRFCTLCGHKGRFHAEIHFPDIFVFDAICPACGGNTRNRLLKLAVDRLGLVPPGARVLHFAPEASVAGFLRPMAGTYRTADLYASGIDQKPDLELNIEAIDQPDASWDVVVCSHVLEHVDHVKALAEMRRILAPGGKLLAMFPVVEGWDGDYENPQISSPRDRGLHFGKEDHLRRFGTSIRGAFAAAGLDLERFAPIGPEVVNYGLIPGETVFIGHRK